jgi:hypothetical protein
MKPSPGTRKSIPLAQAMPATLSWAAGVNANVITQGKPLSAWQAADAWRSACSDPKRCASFAYPACLNRIARIFAAWPTSPASIWANLPAWRWGTPF